MPRVECVEREGERLMCELHSAGIRSGVGVPGGSVVCSIFAAFGRYAVLLCMTSFPRISLPPHHHLCTSVALSVSMPLHSLPSTLPYRAHPPDRSPPSTNPSPRPTPRFPHRHTPTPPTLPHPPLSTYPPPCPLPAHRAASPPHPIPNSASAGIAPSGRPTGSRTASDSGTCAPLGWL